MSTSATARPAKHVPSTAARRRSGSPAAGTASASPSTFRDGKPHARPGASAASSSSGQDSQGRAQRARRLLPAHGRRPDPGHGQGRRDRLPVPRLALGRRRQVQGDPLRPAGPAARAHPEVRDRGCATASCWSGTTSRAPRRPRHPAAGARRASAPTSTPTGPGTSSTSRPRTAARSSTTSSDMAHFFYVHFAFPTSFRNVFEGHMATQFMESTGRPDMAGEGYGDEDLVLKSEATYYGPSYMINWLDDRLQGLRTEVVLINCHIPTGPTTRSRCSTACTVQEARGRRREDRPTTSAKRTPRCSATASCRTCTSGRTRRRSRTRCSARRTARSTSCAAGTSSSTSTRPTSTPEMTERFEFEVDTTKANEYWHAEVAENLAQKAAEDDGQRRRRRTPDGLLRPDQRGDAGGPASLHPGAPDRGRLPGLPGHGRGEEEQRAPHLDPVDAEALRALRRSSARWRPSPGAAHVYEACSAADAPRSSAPSRDGADRRSGPRMVLSMTESFVLKVRRRRRGDRATRTRSSSRCPTSCQEQFAYTPGQFLTVAVPERPDRAGRALLLAVAARRTAAGRSRSRSSAPSTATPPTGSATTSATGDTLRVLPPSGIFTPRDLDADLLLFAGGCGITPVMSITRTALEQGHRQGRALLRQPRRAAR